jgi:hypothetical protein
MPLLRPLLFGLHYIGEASDLLPPGKCKHVSFIRNEHTSHRNVESWNVCIFNTIFTLFIQSFMRKKTQPTNQQVFSSFYCNTEPNIYYGNLRSAMIKYCNVDDKASLGNGPVKQHWKSSECCYAMTQYTHINNGDEDLFCVVGAVVISRVWSQFNRIE